jgi:hypothetical protein
MKDRIELAKYFAELGLVVGAEVGVYKGGYSIELCKANPNLVLYCIDKWGIDDKTEKRRNLHMKIYNYAKRKLSPYNAIVVRDYSINAAKQFNLLDFVYIDANHSYEEVSQDIQAWAEKVRPGGIVSGHDYDFTDVKKAVDEYVIKNNYKLNTTEDQNCSWWFVK